MRRNQATARRYAKALLALAIEQGLGERVGDELRTLAEVFGDPALTRRVSNPWMTPVAVRKAAVDAGERLGVSRPVRALLGLLAARGRLDHLEDIGRTYRELLDASLGRVHATVRTAVSLTEPERRQLADRLGRRLGGAQVIIDETVDRSLLGGFVAQVGSRVLDASLDGQLARIRERLKRG